jgi:ubiquinone/menaquinone biosynthesis C-methylase UbiE
MSSESPDNHWSNPDPRVVAEWIDERERTDRMFAPFGKRLLEAADVVPGETVLDLGCGTGATTVAAWERVKPNGSVTGIDVSTTMLESARARVRGLADSRINWLQADVQSYSFEPGTVDVAISRFGVAHFADTTTAFANIKTALRPNGRFVFTEWTARAENEWMTLLDDTARRALPELFGGSPQAPEHASDFTEDRGLRSLLEATHFEVEAIDRFRAGLWLGATPSDVLAWLARLPEGRVLESLDAIGRQRLLGALEAELVRRTQPDGVYVAGTSWIVRCRA